MVTRVTLTGVEIQDDVACEQRKRKAPGARWPWTEVSQQARTHARTYVRTPISPIIWARAVRWRSPSAQPQRELRTPLKLFSALALSCVQTCAVTLSQLLRVERKEKKNFSAQTMCADCSTSREEEKPICQLLNSADGMASRAAVCQRGCGLLLSGDGGEHCCVDALRTLTDALEERRAAVEHEARMARLRWNRREQVLLAQVSTLQSEAQLAALQYQRRLHQYMLHISSIAEQVIGYCKVYTELCVASKAKHDRLRNLTFSLLFLCCFFF